MVLKRIYAIAPSMQCLMSSLSQPFVIEEFQSRSCRIKGPKFSTGRAVVLDLFKMVDPYLYIELEAWQHQLQRTASSTHACFECRIMPF